MPQKLKKKFAAKLRTRESNCCCFSLFLPVQKMHSVLNYNNLTQFTLLKQQPN